MSIQRTLRNLIRRLEALPDPSDDADPEAWGDAGGAVAREATEALLRHGRADLHAKGQDLVGCAEPTRVRVFVYECLAEVAPKPGTLTPAEVARRYKVRQQKVRNWIEAGELRAVNTSKGTQPRYRISLEALAEFDKLQATQPTLKPRRRTKQATKDYF